MDRTRELKDAELEEVAGAVKCCIGYCPPPSGGGADEPETENPGDGQLGGEHPLSDFVDG
jgi:hypothetical protein